MRGTSVCLSVCLSIRQTDRQTDRWTDRQTDRQTRVSLFGINLEVHDNRLVLVVWHLSMDWLLLLHDNVDVPSDELRDGLSLGGLDRVERLGVVTKVLGKEGEGERRWEGEEGRMEREGGRGRKGGRREKVEGGGGGREEGEEEVYVGRGEREEEEGGGRGGGACRRRREGGQMKGRKMMHESHNV